MAQMLCSVPNATTIQNLELSRGTWEIVLNGSNVLEGKGKVNLEFTIRSYKYGIFSTIMSIQ